MHDGDLQAPLRRLHQGATIFKLGKPAIDPAMLWPLLVMLAAYGLLALLVVLLGTRNEVLERRLNG